MSCCIIRKVPFRNGKRIVWGLVLCEREGVALLVLQRPDNTKTHSLVVGTEGTNGIFEPAEVTRFPLMHGDLESLGGKFASIGDTWDEDAFFRFLKADGDEWWKNL